MCGIGNKHQPLINVVNCVGLPQGEARARSGYRGSRGVVAESMIQGLKKRLIRKGGNAFVLCFIE